MAKIKISRSYTWKAYKVNNDSKTSFVFKSDCEYYVEKFVLDEFQNNQDTLNEMGEYQIFKCYLDEEGNVTDKKLALTISYDEESNKINIR